MAAKLAPREQGRICRMVQMEIAGRTKTNIVLGFRALELAGDGVQSLSTNFQLRGPLGTSLRGRSLGSRQSEGLEFTGRCCSRGLESYLICRCSQLLTHCQSQTAARIPAIIRLPSQ